MWEQGLEPDWHWTQDVSLSHRDKTSLNPSQEPLKCQKRYKYRPRHGDSRRRESPFSFRNAVERGEHSL
jgi:hypothetical protein